jgi:hypothetical protein
MAKLSLTKLQHTRKQRDQTAASLMKLEMLEQVRRGVGSNGSTDAQA